MYFLATPGVNYRVHSGSDSANWSLPLSTHYLESVELILKIREMKVRFIDENRAVLDDARHLRSVANRVATRSVLIRVLGPHAAVWLRTHRARLGVRTSGRGVPAPVHHADVAGALRLVVLCRQRDISRREGRAGYEPDGGRPGFWTRLSSRVDRDVGGVQVHVENVAQFFERAGSQVAVVTPYDAPWLLPVIGAIVTKLLRLRNREAAERWRRHWQRWLLSWAIARAKRGLKEPGPPVVLYAQCPIAAEVALRWREPD